MEKKFEEIYIEINSSYKLKSIPSNIEKVKVFGFFFLFFQLLNCLIISKNLKLQKTLEWDNNFDKFLYKHSKVTSINSISFT